MKSILFVLDYYLPHRWWVENVFENIILRLTKKWYKIIILTSQYDKNLKKYEKNGNIEIYRKWNSRIWFMLWAVRLWKKILRENKVDVIHASTYGGAIPASVLWKKFNKKVILTVHEIFGKLWFGYKWLFLGYIYKTFERIIFKFKYDKYHCVSNNTKNELSKSYDVDKNKLKVIHNGIDNEFWNSKNVESREIFELRKQYERKDNFVFLYFGHAGKSKWIDYLVNALPELINIENSIFVFNIIESKRTKKILDKLNNIKTSLLSNKKWLHSNHKIQIFNWFSKNDLRKLVASCDCVIAPSISEWFGSVHTEAVAMWKTLITTRTSAIPEVVWGNVKFIEPHKSSEIVFACEEVIKWNYENIPRKEFDWNKSVEKIEQLY